MEAETSEKTDVDPVESAEQDRTCDDRISDLFRDDRIFLFGISQSGDDGNDECRRKTDGIGVPVGDVENRGICGGVSGRI